LDYPSAKRNCCANGILTNSSFLRALPMRKSGNFRPKLHAVIWNFGPVEISGRWWLARVSPLVFASLPLFMNARFALIPSPLPLLLQRKRQNFFPAVIEPYCSRTVRLPRTRIHLLAPPCSPCLFLRRIPGRPPWSRSSPSAFSSGSRVSKVCRHLLTSPGALASRNGKAAKSRGKRGNDGTTTQSLAWHSNCSLKRGTTNTQLTRRMG
jgi:hypothetical protein